MFTYDIGVDLGTTNTLFYIRKKGIVLNEPTLVAIDKNKVIAVGKEALAMVGKEPKQISMRQQRQCIESTLFSFVVAPVLYMEGNLTP